MFWVLGKRMECGNYDHHYQKKIIFVLYMKTSIMWLHILSSIWRHPSNVTTHLSNLGLVESLAALMSFSSLASLPFQSMPNCLKFKFQNGNKYNYLLFSTHRWQGNGIVEHMTWTVDNLKYGFDSRMFEILYLHVDMWSRKSSWSFTKTVKSYLWRQGSLPQTPDSLLCPP